MESATTSLGCRGGRVGPDDAPPEFAIAVRAARLRHAMAMRDLARAAKVSVAYIGFIENNQCPPPSDTVITRLCGALGLDTESWLARKYAAAVPAQLRGSVVAIWARD